MPLPGFRRKMISCLNEIFVVLISMEPQKGHLLSIFVRKESETRK